MRKSLLVLVGICMTVPISTLPAGEGMWLFSNPPKKLLAEKYKFEKDQAWYDHVMKASVRFNTGGSGSFAHRVNAALTSSYGRRARRAITSRSAARFSSQLPASRAGSWGRASSGLAQTGC